MTDHPILIETDQPRQYTRSVGRPVLDPDTIGFEPDIALASVDVRVARSKNCVSPPTSADILQNVDRLPRLGTRDRGGIGVDQNCPTESLG